MRYWHTTFEKENGIITLIGYIAFKENYFIASRTFTFTEDNGKGRANLTITEDTGRKYPLKRSITTADKQKLVEFINKFDVSLLINTADTIKRDWENFTGFTPADGLITVEEVFKRNEECWHRALV